MNNDLKQRNFKTLLTVMAVVTLMVGMSFAAVPLYRVFCQLTGFGGTTQVSDSLPTETLERIIRVRFNTDTGRNILWSFESASNEVDIKLGQQGIMSFLARNNDKVPVTGVAVYNVTPPKAGKYFHKLQCFCFGEQTLNPGEEATYPVVFYIDPSMDRDPNMADVRVITLSYTFFPAETPELERAMEDFYAKAETSGTVALKPETK